MSDFHDFYKTSPVIYWCPKLAPEFSPYSLIRIVMNSDLASRAHLLPPDEGGELPWVTGPPCIPRRYPALPQQAGVSLPPFQSAACQMGLASSSLAPHPSQPLSLCSGREAVRRDIQNNRAVAGWDPGGRSTRGSHKVSLGTCCGKGKKHFVPTLVPAEELVWHTNGCLKT